MSNQEPTENASAPLSKSNTLDPAVLPPQLSATDTSNWDNRTFSTPNGRLIIETDQVDKGTVIAE